MTTRRMVTLGVIVGLVLGVIVVALAVSTSAPPAPSARADRAAPVDRGAPVVLAPPPAASRPASRHTQRLQERALRLFHSWSRRRSQAWRAPSAARLRALYATGAAANAELALWQAYRRRGLRVEGLRSQVLAVRVLRSAPGRLELLVDERSAGGTIVGAGSQVTLPQDRADRRQVLLVRGADAHWRVARVSRPARPR